MRTTPSSEALRAAFDEAALERIAATQYDAIVVGAGAAGGLAALLLCEAGLKTLVLDAGAPRTLFNAPYSTALRTFVRGVARPELFEMLPLSVSSVGRKALRLAGRARQPVQSRCFAWEYDPGQLVDDRDNPYATDADTDFTWFRARQLGGRMIVPGHGRQYYRLSRHDLNPTDGLSPAWPVSSEELDPWYGEVERRLELRGRRDGHDWLPDGHVVHETTPTAAEAALQAALVEQWPDAQPILGRYAPPLDGLSGAADTGRLACRRGAIVREVLVNNAGEACGVGFIDHETRAYQRAEAPLVFMCASTLESTRILMLSQSDRLPNGVGGGSNALGRNLMDHVIMSANGVGQGLPGGRVALEDGRSVYLPRFDTCLDGDHNDQRGFGVQLYQMSRGPDASYFQAVALAEMAPRAENRLELDDRRKDRWGVPTLKIRCTLDDAELERTRRQAAALREIAETLDVKIGHIDAKPTPPGMAIHECGTARMGTNPERSVLDPHNQAWDAKGLYVTDGASFPSQGVQNPTLTIMALTARACDHALRATDRKATPQ